MRFPSESGERYRFEAHGAIASGLARRGWVATACGLGRKDPTQWMGGGPNAPPPWDWRADPAREDPAVAACEIQAPGGGAPRRLGDVHAERGMAARFSECAGILRFAYGALAECCSFRVPRSPPAGRAGDPTAPAECRPFASPRHWAAFVALGDAARVQPG